MQLKKLLEYSNEHVLDRYRQDYPNNLLTAEESLQELLKFFWLCDKHQKDVTAQPYNEELKFSCVIHTEMKEIDDMWHTFLLFTRDYEKFCKKYFTYFFHHTPNFEKGEISKTVYETELTCYFSYIYDNLGEASLRKWFAEYDN